MGWMSYGVYGGDGTQVWHYDFIKWSGIKIPKYQLKGYVREDDIMAEWMGSKTKIPKPYIQTFKNGLDKIVKKMPKTRYFDEDKAIEWQMLLALCLDNKVKPTQTILDNGIEATIYLMGDHARDFDNPSNRRSCLKRFIKKANRMWEKNIWV